MVAKTYKDQVNLILSVLPEVAKEDCLALHGGTAINLFVRNMPRLSVDIDLTYIPIENRETSLSNIKETLLRIKKRIETVIKDVSVNHQKAQAKLQISKSGVGIKIEVNVVNRGILTEAPKTTLNKMVQEEFDAFCAIKVVPIGQLYGGKICAALDRQHPRDLFDVKYLVEANGFTNEIKEGFLMCLLSSNRPIHELLFPNLLNQKVTMQTQFEGMTAERFTYEDFKVTRDKLIGIIQSSIGKDEGEFLLNFKNVTPDWRQYDFQHFPGVIWKLNNLDSLKTNNPAKHAEMYSLLKEKIDGLS